MTTSQLSEGLASVLGTLSRRVKKTVPDDAKCQDDFQQWADALQMAIRYPGEQSAKDYAMATAHQLTATLKEHGVLTV